MAATCAADLAQVSEYARLLASVGINGCDINNVNAAPELLDDGAPEGDCKDCRRDAAVGRAVFCAERGAGESGELRRIRQPAIHSIPAVKAWWAAEEDGYFAG